MAGGTEMDGEGWSGVPYVGGRDRVKSCIKLAINIEGGRVKETEKREKVVLYRHER